MSSALAARRGGIVVSGAFAAAAACAMSREASWPEFCRAFTHTTPEQASRTVAIQRQDRMRQLWQTSGPKALVICGHPRKSVESHLARRIAMWSVGTSGWSRGGYFGLGLTLALAAGPDTSITAQQQHAHGTAASKPTARLFEGLGQYHRPIVTSNPDAQRYFDQGLT